MLEIPNLAATSRALLQAYDLPASDERNLMLLLNRCFPEELADGKPLCREGEEGGRMWFLLDGEVRVVKKDFLGVDQELGRLHAPTMIGHMSLVDGGKRSASCIALGPVLVVSLDERMYGALVEDPGAAGHMLRSLILSGMVQQMARGSARLAEVVEAAARAGQGSDHKALGRQLGEVSGTLDGWTARAPRAA